MVPSVLLTCFTRFRVIFVQFETKFWSCCNPALVFAWCLAYNHSVKGPQKPKPYCDNKLLRSHPSPLVFTVRSGTVWRQDLVILSPKASSESTYHEQARTRRSLVKSLGWTLSWGGCLLPSSKSCAVSQLGHTAMLWCQVGKGQVWNQGLRLPL